MTKKSCNFDNESLSISESYFDLKREPDKNQIMGNTIEYLFKFIDWCFFVPAKSYNWTKESRYCYKIKNNCSICKLMEDKKDCRIKEDVKRLLKYSKK